MDSTSVPDWAKFDITNIVSSLLPGICEDRNDCIIAGKREQESPFSVQYYVTKNFV